VFDVVLESGEEIIHSFMIFCWAALMISSLDGSKAFPGHVIHIFFVPFFFDHIDAGLPVRPEDKPKTGLPLYLCYRWSPSGPWEILQDKAPDTFFFLSQRQGLPPEVKALFNKGEKDLCPGGGSWFNRRFSYLFSPYTNVISLSNFLSGFSSI
jgi:hypothetical protein